MINLINMINKMKSDRLGNYIVPGLNSYLINNGKVRIFENTREQHHYITPHTHRFDFACLVLQGEVWNTLYTKTSGKGELFSTSKLEYNGKPGEYEQEYIYDHAAFRKVTYSYKSGETYTMEHHEFHSIKFSEDAIVLFLEGPTIIDKTWILEPVVDGKVVPTFETKPWMFEK